LTTGSVVTLDTAASFIYALAYKFLMSKRGFHLGRLAILFTLCLVLAAFVGQAGQAGQVRSVADGVYSAAQAARGQQIYQTQCAGCVGRTMEGSSGPPLAGNDFLSNWSARPLTSLVDKIEKTMPFNLPGSLSRPQSTELTAYILQFGKFPAGQADLSDG